MVLHDLGLAAALESECEYLAKRLEIPVHCEVAACPKSIDPLMALSLFRVAQECLRNIGKHSAAKAVFVEVFAREDGLILTVRDDGVVFDVEAAGGRGRLGLTSMRERMRLVSGEISIQSQAGGGTTVTAVIPRAVLDQTDQIILSPFENGEPDSERN
jgi:signal transduction histidine kinase